VNKSHDQSDDFMDYGDDDEYDEEDEEDESPKETTKPKVEFPFMKAAPVAEDKP
jgi:hypothetical protein